MTASTLALLPAACLMALVTAGSLGCRATDGPREMSEIREVPETREMRVVALGDSTTVGYDVPDNYPIKLQRKLRENGLAVTVINSGVNGDTTTGARTRFDRDVLAHHPDLVIIQFGLNDQTMRLYQKPETIKPYVTKEQFADNLRYFITTLREHDARVLLMTPNPMSWTPVLEKHYPDGPYLTPPDGGNALLERYVEIFRKLAREEKIPLVDIYQKYIDYEHTPGQSLADLFLGDGVHPNDRAYAMNVELIAPQVRAILTSSNSK